MNCKDCVHHICVGTRVKDGVKLYECHRDKPIWLGERINRGCKFWKAKGETKGKVIKIFD